MLKSCNCRSHTSCKVYYQCNIKYSSFANTTHRQPASNRTHFMLKLRWSQGRLVLNSLISKQRQSFPNPRGRLNEWNVSLVHVHHEVNNQVIHDSCQHERYTTGDHRKYETSGTTALRSTVRDSTPTSTTTIASGSSKRLEPREHL